jgi:hypothetical protein
MQTVYCVWASSGFYENFHSYIVKAFFDPQAAEDFKNEYNQKIKEEKTQKNKCNACMSRFFETEITDLELQSSFTNVMLQECENANIQFDEDGWVSCANYVDSWDFDESHEAHVKPLIVN